MSSTDYEPQRPPAFIQKEHHRRNAIQSNGVMPPGYSYEEVPTAPVYPPSDPIDRAMTVYNWFWPAFSWLMFIFNLTVMAVVARDMVFGRYEWWAHAGAGVIGGLCFVLLAGTYRYVLNPPAVTPPVMLSPYMPQQHETVFNNA